MGGKYKKHYASSITLLSAWRFIDQSVHSGLEAPIPRHSQEGQTPQLPHIALRRVLACGRRQRSQRDGMEAISRSISPGPDFIREVLRVGVDEIPSEDRCQWQWIGISTASNAQMVVGTNGVRADGVVVAEVWRRVTGAASNLTIETGSLYGASSVRSSYP